MKWLKRVAIGVGVLLAMLLVVGLLLPKDYRVERSVTIAAPPSEVYAHVANLKRWDAWSPWAKDPTIVNTYSGPEQGLGSKVSWTSDDSGAGSQKIIAADEPRSLRTHLDFGEMGEAEAYWRFEAVGDETEVLWGLEGDNPGVLGGYFTLMMDNWVGGDYERGLESLKRVVEESAN